MLETFLLTNPKNYYKCGQVAIDVMEGYLSEADDAGGCYDPITAAEALHQFIGTVGLMLE